MNVTVEQIVAGCGATRARAEKWLPYIQHAMTLADIDTPLRAAAFLAHVGHESAGLTRLTENLNYSWHGLMKTWPSRFKTEQEARNYANQPQAIANKVYANRMGNGDEASGDGWRYRGKGLIQITGRTNHLLCGMWLDLDLLNRPELLLEMSHAADSAAWFWQNNYLNELADEADMRRMTQRINGGLLGLDDRLAKFEKALSTFA